MRAKLGWAVLAAMAVVIAPAARSWAQERTPAAITDIRQEANERSTRLMVECSGPLAYTYYSPDPLTLVVDIPEVDASKIPSRISVGTREVDSLRVSSLARADGRNLARLEVRLASLVPYQIFSKGKELTLIFDRPTATASAASSVPPPPPLPAAAPAPAPASGASTESLPAEPPAQTVADAPVKTEPQVFVPSKRAPAEPLPPSLKVSLPPKADAHPKAEKAPLTGPRATQILAVMPSTEGGTLGFTVKADGHLRYQDFFLGNPDRLVVDFPDVLAKAPVRSLDVNKDPVRKVRLGQFSAGPPKVARLVLDLSNRAPYHIVDGADGLKIVFGEGQTPSPTPLAALRTPDPEPAAEPAPAPEPMMAAALPAPATALPAPAPAPPAALTMPALPEPQLGSAREAAATGDVPTGQKQYTGAPISLDFKDGDLQDIFRLFADISGLNVVVNPGVSGKVTLKLNEVPWDQALDLILKTNGLGYTLEDNVIRIAKLSDLQKEEQEKRKLAEEKALAGDLETMRKRLSYAKAGDLEPSVKKVALSSRGQITLDTRTNTMIITDLPAYLEKARDLIAELDRATPQVEIEARIVVTTRDFTRQLGIQWGFNHEQSARYGNATNKSFPNAIVINGGAVPNTLGIDADQGGQAPAAGIGTAGRGYLVNLPAAGFNTGLGISLGNILGNFNLDAALTALERQGRGRLLSTPKVTTQNNKEAEIKQGVQIPIQTVANNTVTVQFKDAVLTLKVTPQITDANTVIMDLSVENNSPDFARQVNGIPPINTQSAKTIVLVKDGATAVVGGIYQSTETTSQSRTPFLGQIPIVGYLFRNRSLSTQNQELLLFITPRITKG
jgi:type IV pilus secretin PilQ/predicted competence protein